MNSRATSDKGFTGGSPEIGESAENEIKRRLSELGLALRDTTLRDLLRRRAPDESIMERIRELGEATTGQFPVRRSSR